MNNAVTQYDHSEIFNIRMEVFHAKDNKILYAVIENLNINLKVVAITSNLFLGCQLAFELHYQMSTYLIDKLHDKKQLQIGYSQY